MKSRIYAVVGVIAGTTLLGLGCESKQAAGPDDAPKTAKASSEMTPAAPASHSPTAAAAGTPGTKAAGHDEGALHNVHRLGPRLVSSAAPEGDAAFDQLKAMGIKTIITVDGAAPDVERARARGMRYVHIPITYATVTPEQQAELARAVRDLPGPILIHCHHGKHRGPAAAASVAVLLGEATPEEGVAFMKQAGTAASYAGLYACVQEAGPAGAALDSAPADFPSVRKPAGMVAAMVEVDLAYEHLGHIRAAGWKVPIDHPDLVPAAEAGRLADHLRFSGETAKSKRLGEAYQKLLLASIAAATDLEEAIVAGAKPEVLEAKWKPVAASCKDCHANYRDKTGPW